MTERLQEHDFVRASINLELGGIPGIRLPDGPLLGSGGQGWVFRAVETNTGAPRALKVHRAIEGMSAEDAAQSAAAFENEGECLKQFDHPNIIKVFRTGVHERTIRSGDDGDLWHTKDYLYMLMEYAELGSVADRIKKGQARNIGMLPVEEAVLCIVHATEGMRYAHGETGELSKEMQMTHGDLNPHNLVIAAADGRDRVVKVADFGIARRAHSSVETMTSTQLHAFSLPYASPGQIETGNVFLADDVYSLGGVTAYELLSGIRPFDPEYKTPYGYFNAHKTAVVPPMERLNSDGKVDPVVYALNEPVLTALNRDPGGRTYATMAEYQAAFIEAWAAGTAEAAKARTVIILPKKKDTLPLLLGAELPPEGETMGLTLSDETILSSETTEAAGDFPSNTRLSKPEADSGMSRRRFGELAIGLVMAGVVAGGALWLNEKRQDDLAEKERQEKLNKERAAIVGLGYKVVDLLANASDGPDEPGTEITVPTLLGYILPSDPKGVVSWIEKLQGSADSYYHISLLTARLAHYNPEATLKIMQARLEKKEYGAAAVIAMQLASLAQAPDGVGTNWRPEAEKVRAIIASETTIGEKNHADYDKVLAAALDITSKSAAGVLSDLLHNDYYSIYGRALALAMAKHNPTAVGSAMSELVDRVKALPTTAKITWHSSESYYGDIELTCAELVRYAPDKVRELIGQIDKDNRGVNFSSRAETAIQRLTVLLTPYDAKPTKDYVKNGSEASSDWNSNRWGSTAVVALGSIDPTMVSAHSSAAASSPFGEFMSASLDPLDTDRMNKALAALKDPSYLKEYGADLIIALLKSRQIRS